jgi:hypothetical protein
MKKLHIIILSLFVLIILAFKNIGVTFDKKKVPVFSWKVFELSNGINEKNCGSKGNDAQKNIPTYIFVNDSVFIKILETWDYTHKISHLSGIYKATHNKLTLKYDSVQIVYYVQLELDTLDNTYKTFERIGKESIFSFNEPLITYIETLPIFYCDEGFYFREIWAPWSDHLIALTSQQPEDWFTQMKKINVWDKLKRNR